MERRYYTLMASLPFLPKFFYARRLPLSRAQLEERLELLEEADARILQEFEFLTLWNHLPFLPSAEFLLRAEYFLGELRGPLAELMRLNLELRMLITGVRLRNLGRKPQDGEPWGFGPLLEAMTRHWDHPSFHLEGRYPFLPDLVRSLQAGNPRESEYFLLNLKYEQLKAIEEDHEFDLTAVILYVLRWHLVDRWTQQDPEVALAAFISLAEEVRAPYVAT